MATFLLAPFMTPFTIALGVFLGLLLLEVLAALLGGSILGLGGEADSDIDLDADLDADLDTDLDLDADVAASTDLDVDLVAGTEVDLSEGVEASSTHVGLLAWLGLGQVPLMIWLGVFLLAFGFGGLLLQSVLEARLAPLPAGLASAVMAPLAVLFTGRFAKLFARLLPKVESEAVSRNHLGRRRGVISQGSAARGKPAEVRVMDGHGNTHYIRAEPLRDEDVLAQGTEVLVMRKSLNEGYRLIAISE